VEDSDEAARLLAETAKHPTLANRNFLEQSQQMASGYYLDGEGNWGFMHRAVWASFANWLIRNQLITDAAGKVIDQIDAERLFTNEYLEEIPVTARF
jgi:NitT/TauT family transport system substrate-binding protein